VPPYELAGLRVPKNQKFLSPPARHLMWAGLQAFERSGWQRGSLNPDRTAVFTGSGQTGLEPSQTFSGFKVARTPEGVADWAALGGRASRLLDPYFPLRSLSNSGLALLAMELGARGPSNNFVQSDTAGAQALDAAMGCLEDDECDLAICGAFESLLTPANELNYRRMGLVSPRGRIAPFDREADGLVLGEAGVALLLERRADAKARGAAILATLSVDSGAPRPHFVVVEGHGVPAADREAAAAVHFDGPCTAFKGATGYLGAATALVEAVLAIQALHARLIPPVVGLGELADGIGLQLVRGEAVRLPSEGPVSARCLSRSWMGGTASVTVTVD
jgi:3-oxoacyl-[acyl-carrier-protein] synthase II